jgi:hypothetical protein
MDYLFGNPNKFSSCEWITSSISTNKFTVLLFYYLFSTSCFAAVAISRELTPMLLTFWDRSFTFNSNKSPTWCNNISVYYPDVCIQLNKFRAFFRPSLGAQWLQWQPLVLPSYRGDSRAVFVVGPAEGKTRGCHCSHCAPDDGRENARNILSCKQTSG